MAQEKEIKITLRIPLEDFITRLKLAGFEDKGQVRQTDIYLDTKDWYLYNNIAALRIRLVNDKADSFAFKKVFYFPKQQHPMYVEELEIPFPLTDEAGLAKILSKVNITGLELAGSGHVELIEYLRRSGFNDEQHLRKTRREYRLEDKSLTIDDIEHVGTIIELECAESDPHLEVEKLLAAGEWENTSKEGTGYIWLRNVKGFTRHLDNYKRFETEPDWNVWEQERDFYRNIAK